MSQPAEAEILDALADYRKHVLEHNKKVFTLLVHEAETAEAPADLDNERIAEMRRKFMYHQLCVSRSESLTTEDPRHINVPRDVLERWDDLVAISGFALDGSTVERDEAQGAVSREQWAAHMQISVLQVTRMCQNSAICSITTVFCSGLSRA